MAPFILVVDNEEDLRSEMAAVARRVGAEVIEARTAQEALDLIAQHQFHVVVTDLVLETGTEEDGFRVLKESVRQGLAQVIIVTSYGARPISVICMREGAYDYVERRPASPLIGSGGESYRNRLRTAIEGAIKTSR